MEIHLEKFGHVKTMEIHEKARDLQEVHWELEHFMELLLESPPYRPLNRSKAKTKTKTILHTETPTTLEHNFTIVHEFTMGDPQFVPPPHCRVCVGRVYIPW